MKTSILKILLFLTIAGWVAGAALAREASPLAPPPFDFGAEPSPIAANFAVTVERATQGKSRDKPEPQTWYFYRDAQRVAVLKGNIDEVWRRDAQQRISFERVFHDDARVVDYSTGELATLQVNTDWASLSGFVDPAELVQLKVVARSGKGRLALLHFRGSIGKEYVEVDWMPALELPRRVLRRVPGTATVSMHLLMMAPTPLPYWPVVGARSANYLRIDAADFGDMSYDPVVRKSQAIDIRLGWRVSHSHD